MWWVLRGDACVMVGAAANVESLSTRGTVYRESRPAMPAFVLVAPSEVRVSMERGTVVQDYHRGFPRDPVLSSWKPHTAYPRTADELLVIRPVLSVICSRCCALPQPLNVRSVLRVIPLSVLTFTSVTAQPVPYPAAFLLFRHWRRSLPAGQTSIR